MRRIRAFGVLLVLSWACAYFAWLASGVGILIVSFLINMGPGEFARFTARPVLALAPIVAAFTAPLWLMALVSVALREKTTSQPQPAGERTPPAVATVEAPGTLPVPGQPPIVLLLAILAGLSAIQYSRAATDLRGFVLVQAAVSFFVAAVLGALWRWRVVSLRRGPVTQP